MNNTNIVCHQSITTFVVVFILAIFHVSLQKLREAPSSGLAWKLHDFHVYFFQFFFHRFQNMACDCKTFAKPLMHLTWNMTTRHESPESSNIYGSLSIIFIVFVYLNVFVVSSNWILVVLKLWAGFFFLRLCLYNNFIFARKRIHFLRMWFSQQGPAGLCL